MLETFEKYSGTGLIVGWFLVSWVYLLLTERKKPNRILFVYMPAGVLLIFFNPVFYKIFGGMTEEAIYFRFLWLLPITVVIAYSAVRIYNGLQGKNKIIFGMISCFLIVISGKPVYNNMLFERAENPYHVPQEVVEICDMIKVEGREVMAAFPVEFLLYVRQYSPYVCMPYGREAFEFYNDFYALMGRETIEVEELAVQSKQYGCHYIIISAEKELVGDMKDFSYEVFGWVGDYIIYTDTSIYKGL